MILAAIIGFLFYRAAEKKNLKPWLWAILGAGSYFGGQFFAGIIIGLTNPEMLEEDNFSLLGIALVAGLVAVGITYLVMESVGKNNKTKKESVNEDLLDDRYLHKP